MTVRTGESVSTAKLGKKKEDTSKEWGGGQKEGRGILAEVGKEKGNDRGSATRWLRLINIGVQKEGVDQDEQGHLEGLGQKRTPKTVKPVSTETIFGQDPGPSLIGVQKKRKLGTSIQT